MWKENLEEDFKTRDLNLTAYLKMKWFRIIWTEKNNWIVTFVFEKSQEIIDAKFNFFNNDWGFKDFTNVIRDLKILIHNE